MANNQPIIFDLKYTTYEPSKKANDYERNLHGTERAFFNMTGEENIYKYITTEGKRVGKFTALEYLQKNTGVFNQDGMIPSEKADEMKARLKENKGNIWHGFISFNEHDSEKIDTPEKCIRLVKETFPSFFRDAGLKPDNIDLMCARHLDRPHHLHIHFVFWEKEEKYKGKDGTLEYRKKGKIGETAIDRMFVRLGLFADEKKEYLHKARDDAVKALRKMTNVHSAMYSKDKIRQEIISLSKDLPATGRLSYCSEDMKPYRERVDKIVKMLLDYDKTARQENVKFYDALEKRKQVIKNICGTPHTFLHSNIKPQDAERELPEYHHKKHTIDESKINIVEQIEADYKRRQGNLVLNLCKFVKPEYFERKKGKKYNANDDSLKRSLSISNKKVSRRIDRFFASFGRECQYLERDFSHRLQDIEQEIERKRKDEQEQAQAHENYKEVKEKE